MVIFVQSHEICKSGFLVSIKSGSVTQPYTGKVAQILIIEQYFLIMKRGPGAVVLISWFSA